MRELGAHSDELHAGLAPAVLDAHVDQLILIGDEMRAACRAAWSGRIALDLVANVDEATDALLPHRSAPATRCWSRPPTRSGLRSSSSAWQRGLRMLYVIAEQLGFPGILNLIRYISFRAGAASATALLIGLLLGPKFISWLRAKQGKGQPIRADGPQSHLAKRGTPTMGGLLILISVAISVLLWMDLTNPYVWACLLVTGGLRADRLARRLRQGQEGASRRPFAARRGWRSNS